MLRPKSFMVLDNIGLRNISLARLRTTRKSSDGGLVTLVGVCCKGTLLLNSEALLIFDQTF